MSQGFGNAAWTILLPSWIAKTWILLTASKQPPAFHPLQERQRTRLPRHRSFKRTWRPPHHQRIEEAHAQRSILGVWFPPPSISKTRTREYQQVISSWHELWNITVKLKFSRCKHFKVAYMSNQGLRERRRGRIKSLLKAIIKAFFQNEIQIRY